MIRNLRIKIIIVLLFFIATFAAYHHLWWRGQPSFKRVPENSANSLYNDGSYQDPAFLSTSSPQTTTFITSENATHHISVLPTSAPPTILILVLTSDFKSWGVHPTHSGIHRNFTSFLSLISSTNLDPVSISLGILTSSYDSYDEMLSLVPTLPFARTHLIHHPGHPNPSADLDRSDRHTKVPRLQTQRRSTLAKLRNHLMLSALTFSTKHIIWLDADIYTFHSPSILERMMAHSDRPPSNTLLHGGVGMITALCHQGESGTRNYDKNAWSGRRTRGDGGTRERILLEFLVDQSSSDDDLVGPLTAVGGSILYLRAGLVWQGLAFPAENVIGGEWPETNTLTKGWAGEDGVEGQIGRDSEDVRMFDGDGWDGIESEGLCWRAKGLSGGTGCWGLGGRWWVEHTDDG